MRPKDQDLLRVVDEVLHYVWDPIGVSAVPQARDEYASYVGPTFSLLRSGAPDSEISAHLETIVVERMGLAGCKPKSDEAAAVLTGWRDFLS